MDKCIIEAAEKRCGGGAVSSTTKPSTLNPRSTRVLRTTKQSSMQRQMK